MRFSSISNEVPSNLEYFFYKIVIDLKTYVRHPSISSISKHKRTFSPPFAKLYVPHVPRKNSNGKSSSSLFSLHLFGLILLICFLAYVDESAGELPPKIIISPLKIVEQDIHTSFVRIIDNLSKIACMLVMSFQLVHRSLSCVFFYRKIKIFTQISESIIIKEGFILLTSIEDKYR